jgi:hypothetical protein
MVMDLGKLKSSEIVEDTILGIYVWETHDGRWVGDDEGNFLSIASKKGNKANIDALTRVVRSYGIDHGKPLFLAGRRKIDDEEYEYQQQRLNLGLVPDPFDIGNYKDEMKKIKNANKRY